MKKSKPNFLVILIDDLRYDEFGAGGHPYMKTPHIDRLAHEGALFERAFHTTSICSPNRASIVTGQYASRHGIIDNVARGAMSHRLPNYHLELQKLGYETAHIGKWHMGNDGMPRPGYDYWVSYDGHGRIVNPKLCHDGNYVQHEGYITDIMNGLAVEFLEKKHAKPWSLFFAHKAVHPDAEQAADGTVSFGKLGGYIPAERHKDLYKDAIFPKKPNMLSLRRGGEAEAGLEGDLQDAQRAGRRARCSRRSTPARRKRSACAPRMMASVDEGVGMILEALEKKGELDNTCIVFLGDNGYFFGEHGLGPERRFAYEEGIRSPVPGQISEMNEGGLALSRPRHLPGHRAHADRARRRQARAADPGQVVGRHSQEQKSALAKGRARRILGRAGVSVAHRHDLQGDPHRALQADPLGEPRHGTANWTSSTTSRRIRSS